MRSSERLVRIGSIPNRRVARAQRGGRVVGWWPVRFALALLAVVLSAGPGGGVSAQAATRPGRALREAPPTPDHDIRPVIAVNPVTHRVYVAEGDRRKLTVRDGSSVGSGVPPAPAPRGVAHPVPRPPIIGTIPLTVAATDLAVATGPNRLYVLGRQERSVVVVDGARDAVIATLPLPGSPVALRVDRQSGRVYVAVQRDGGGAVAVLDGGAVSAIVPLQAEPVGLTVDSSAGRILVAHRDSGIVSSVDPVSHEVRTLSRAPRPAARRSDGTVVPTATAPAATVASTYTVNTTADAADADLADGRCDVDSVVVGDQCSLRAAIQKANAVPGADAIEVPAGTYALSLVGAGEDAAATGDLDIRDDLAIVGAGASGTIVDGGGTDRVLQIHDGPTVRLEGLTIRGGRADEGGGIYTGFAALSLTDVVVSDNTSSNFGGGIYNTGTLMLARSTVSGNRAAEDGGGIYTWGGSVRLDATSISGNQITNADFSGGGLYVDADGDVSGDDVTFSRNRAGDSGGAIAGESSRPIVLTNARITDNRTEFAGGGGIAGSVDLSDTTVSGNRAGGACCNSGTQGGGISGGGTLTRTVVANNFVFGRGGGIAGPFTATDVTILGNEAVQGGGVHGGGTFTNVTITGNVATGDFGTRSCGAGGGVYALGGSFTNVTISGNTADYDRISWEGTGGPPCFGEGGGGGVFGTGTLTNVTLVGNAARPTEGPVAGLAGNLQRPEDRIGALELRGSIVADSAAGEECIGTITSLGYNLDTGATCGFGAVGDLSNTPALLGPLADNGGATQTHALLPGSPAVDNGPGSGCPPTDQRGTARPQDGNADGVPVCDIGAFEATLMAPTTVPLTVGRSGSGTGTVTSDPAGIDCGTDCTESYPKGTSVILTATPGSGSVFAGWSGACSGSGACAVVMSEARSVTAMFVTADTTPPVTQASTVPAAPNGQNGWFTGAQVAVNLAATDQGGSGVKEIVYTVNGGAPTTVAGASAPITIGTPGITTIDYFSRDNAGNQEQPKLLTVKLDRTAPTIACTAGPDRIWPPNKQLVTVSVAIDARDAESGPVTVRLTTVESTDGAVQSESAGWEVGQDDREGQVRADRDGNGQGRTYRLTYTATNEAGLSSTCAAEVVVPHDQGAGAVHLVRRSDVSGQSAGTVLEATVAARVGCDSIERVELGSPGTPLDNARVRTTAPPGGPQDQVRGFVYTPPPGTTEVVFSIERVVGEGGALVSPLVVTDGCGARSTFVGGGPEAFR